MVLGKTSAILATGALIASTLIAVNSVEAESPISSYLIGPDRGMSFQVGSKHLVTYFDRNEGACDLTIMVANQKTLIGDEYNSATRLKVSLEPGKQTRIDSIEGKSLRITCNHGAKSISVERERFDVTSRAKS